MELKNRVGYFVGWYLVMDYEWIFEIHKGFACYGLNYFQMEEFENDP